MTIRCSTKEEFVEALVFELESDNPGVIPEDWTGYLSRCLHWRDFGADDVHADCIAAADHTALEDEIRDLKEDLEEAKEEDEKRGAYIQTLEERLADFGDTAPAPDLLRVAARDAVKTLRALLPQLDAPKFTPSDRKRLRMSVFYAAQHLEAATHKAEDETLPEDHAPEPEPAAAAWETATCEAEGVTFRWHRTPMRSPKGVQVGVTTWIAWTPVEGVAAEVGLSRGWGGTLLATLQVWQGGEEVALSDLTAEDRDTLHEQARTLEACLPPA